MFGNGQDAATLKLSNGGHWRVFAPQTITITSKEYQIANTASCYQVSLYRGNLFLAELFEYCGTMFDISGTTPASEWQLGPWTTKMLKSDAKILDVPPTIVTESTKASTLFKAQYGDQFNDYLPPGIILPDKTRHTLAGPYVIRLNVFKSMAGTTVSSTSTDLQTKDVLFTIETNIFIYAPWAVTALSHTADAGKTKPVVHDGVTHTCYTASKLKMGTSATTIPLEQNTLVLTVTYAPVPYTAVNLTGATVGMSNAIYPLLQGHSEGGNSIVATYTPMCEPRSILPATYNSTLANGNDLGNQGTDEGMWGDLPDTSPAELSPRNYSDITRFIAASKCGIATGVHGDSVTFTWSLSSCASSDTRNPTYYRIVLYYLGPAELNNKIQTSDVAGVSRTSAGTSITWRPHADDILSTGGALASATARTPIAVKPENNRGTTAARLTDPANYNKIDGASTLDYTFSIPGITSTNNAMRAGTSPNAVVDSSPVGTATDAALATGTTQSGSGVGFVRNNNQKPFPIGWYQAELQLYTASNNVIDSTAFAQVKSNAVLANGYVTHEGSGGQFLIARNVPNPEYNGATSGSYDWQLGCRITDAAATAATTNYLLPKGNVQVQIGIFASGDSSFTGYSSCFKLIQNHCCRDFPLTPSTTPYNTAGQPLETNNLANGLKRVFNPLGNPSTPSVNRNMHGLIVDGSGTGNYHPNTLCMWWITPSASTTGGFDGFPELADFDEKPFHINLDETRNGTHTLDAFDTRTTFARRFLKPASGQMGNLKADRVRLVFTKFAFPSATDEPASSAGSSSDRLTIYDGIDNRAPKLYEWFCVNGGACDRVLPDARGIVSTGPYVYIEFESNGDDKTADGFELEYTALSSADVMTALPNGGNGVNAGVTASAPSFVPSITAWMPNGQVLFTFRGGNGTASRLSQYETYVRVPVTTAPNEYSANLPGFDNTKQDNTNLRRGNSAWLVKASIIPGATANEPVRLDLPPGVSPSNCPELASTGSDANNVFCPGARVDLRGTGAFSLVVDDTEQFAFVGMNGAIAKIRLADMYFLESIAITGAYVDGLPNQSASVFSSLRWTAGVAGRSGTPSAGYVYFFSARLSGTSDTTSWADLDNAGTSAGYGISLDVQTHTVQFGPISLTNSSVSRISGTQDEWKAGGATIAAINAMGMYSGEHTTAAWAPEGTLIYVGTNRGRVVRFSVNGAVITRLGSTPYGTASQHIMNIWFSPSYDFTYITVAGGSAGSSALHRVRNRDFLVQRSLKIADDLKLDTTIYFPAAITGCPTGDIAVAALPAGATLPKGGIIQLLLTNAYATDGTFLYMDLGGDFPQADTTEQGSNSALLAVTTSSSGFGVFPSTFDPRFSPVARTVHSEQVVNKLWWGSAAAVMSTFGDSPTARQSYERTYSTLGNLGSFSTRWARDNVDALANSTFAGAMNTRTSVPYDASTYRTVPRYYSAIPDAFILMAKPLVDANNALRDITIGSANVITKGCPATLTFTSTAPSSKGMQYSGQGFIPTLGAWTNSYDVVGFLSASLANNTAGTGYRFDTSLAPVGLFATAAPGTTSGTTTTVSVSVPSGIPIPPGAKFNLLVRQSADSLVFGAVSGVTVNPTPIDTVAVGIQYLDPVPGVQYNMMTNITWNCACGTRVSIQLYELKSSLTTFVFANRIAEVDCTSGSNIYMWNVVRDSGWDLPSGWTVASPAGVGGRADDPRFQIRVLAIGGDNTNAVVSSPFRVGLPSNIPADQTLNLGGVLTITWTPSTNARRTGRVDLYKVPAPKDGVLPKATDTTVFVPSNILKRSIPDTGSYKWTVAGSGDVHLAIVTQAAPNNRELLYISPFYTIVPTGLGPVFPSSGSILTKGTVYNVTWMFTGGIDLDTTTVRLELCAGPFNTWTTSMAGGATTGGVGTDLTGGATTPNVPCVPLLRSVAAVGASNVATPTPSPAPAGGSTSTTTPSTNTTGSSTTTPSTTTNSTGGSATTPSTTTNSTGTRNTTRRSLLGFVHPNPLVRCNLEDGTGPCSGLGSTNIVVPPFVPAGVYFIKYSIIQAVSRSGAPTEFSGFVKSELFSVVEAVTDQVSPTSLVFGMTLRGKTISQWSPEDRNNLILGLSQDLTKTGQSVRADRLRIVSEQPGAGARRRLSQSTGSVVLQIEVKETRENGARELGEVGNDVRSRAMDQWTNVAARTKLTVESVSVVSDAPSKTPMLDRNGVIILACLGIPLMTFCGCVCGWFAKTWWQKRKSSKAKDVEAYGGYERVPLQQPAAPQPVYSSAPAGPVYSGGEGAGAN
eukprot:tig00000849_g4779.t1